MVTSGNSKLSIPTFIPFTEAVRKYDLKEDVLTRLIQDGRIEAAQLPSGELLVSEDSLNEKTKEQIIDEKFAHLRGKPISAYAAAQKYGSHPSTFIRWARAGYIQILNEEEHLIEMDEADVAYCALVYDAKKQEYGGRISGVKIFDKDGNPYQLKYPDLSVKRRRQNS